MPGFDLAPASSFRDFARQLAIWNAKYSGAAPIYDASGRPLDAAQLAPAGARRPPFCNGRRSPGASRHHWGTDVDLIDRNAVGAGYRVQLTAAEFTAPGPFAPLAQWLKTHAPRFGFFRPYRGVLSGVQPEPWHFSFAPVAEPARRALSTGVLRAALGAAGLLGSEYVLERLDEIHARYVAASIGPEPGG